MRNEGIDGQTLHTIEERFIQMKSQEIKSKYKLLMNEPFSKMKLFYKGKYKLI